MIRLRNFLISGFFLAIGLTASLPVLGGGFVGAGGGGIGVACFPTAPSAQLEKDLAEGHLLSDAQIASIQSLVTLDAWDLGEGNFQKLHGLTREQVLETVSRQIDDVSPFLSLRLKQLAPNMVVSRWKDGEKAAEDFRSTNDAHPRVPLGANCRLIQLAVRYTNIAPEAHEIPRRLPKVKVVFDPRLFARLDAVNQAMLIVHEELYLMARSLGHPDSDVIRQLVAYFFSDEFLAALRNNKFRTSVQQILVGMLGDYALYFADEPVAGSPGQSGPYTQLSRYHSFISALDKLRAQIEPCRAVEDMRTCKDRVMSPANLVKSLNREEVFVMFAHLILSRRRTAIRTPEFIMVPFQDKNQLVLAERAMADSCSGALDNRFDFTGHDDMIPFLDEALEYCVDATRAHAFGVYHGLTATLATLAVNGDALYLAARGLPPGPEQVVGTQASRSRSFRLVLGEIMRRADACVARSGRTISDCIKAENEPSLLATWVTDEEAFLLYTHYEYDDGVVSGPLPTAALRWPVTDAASTKAASEFFRNACDQTHDGREESSGTTLEALMEKAAAYCRKALRDHGTGYDALVR